MYRKEFKLYRRTVICAVKSVNFTEKKVNSTGKGVNFRDKSIKFAEKKYANLKKCNVYVALIRFRSNELTGT